MKLYIVLVHTRKYIEGDNSREIIICTWFDLQF